MSTPPRHDAAQNPQRRSTGRDNPPSPTEVLAIILDFLRHYWDAPRHKSKWTEVATVGLTVLIAGAAIWSAFIFQAQLTEARKSFHIDQRAWLGPTEALPPHLTENGVPVYMKAGEKSTFDVLLANSGKTPARNVDQRMSYRTLPKDVPFSPKYPTPPERIGVIQPGSKFKWETPATENALSDQVHTYQSGDNVLYIFGEVAYDDIFGTQRHHTTFCMYLLRDLTNLVDCKTYNEAD